MIITLGLSEKEVNEIRLMRWISDENADNFARKQDEEGLSEEESSEFSHWIIRQCLFNKVEGVIDNQLEIDKSLLK